MKTTKDWPYAYQNLQESLRGLIPYLERSNLPLPEALNKYIDPAVTLEQLTSCITVLLNDKMVVQDGTSLEQKMTTMLLDRFIMDATFFKNDLVEEMGLMGIAAHDEG